MQNVIAAAVAAAIVTGGAVYIAQMPKPRDSAIGRFQMMKNGETGVWRLDTTTGELNACYILSGKDGVTRGCVGVEVPPPNHFDKYDTPAQK
ncbi:hypothetical protein [Azospirillum sp. Sh1]|uniref:hypothetical protein n=1 Tax=Azospirillum sp. Sh1 TaxID=2607285 RepID=UPI0011EE15D1|nr:hypothetical protein [Azospirillum sp. Sh1]KAA0573437.1 hypothetical protein FZ029_20890 [Azospirillum sp. Sh1]